MTYLLQGALAAAVLAGFATPGHAADLPAKRAAPVEHVRICSAFGEGFFFLPGSDTCLRIGGRVRAEYRYRTPYERALDATGFRARGRLTFDTRTRTEYGTLRTFIAYEFTQSTGPFTGSRTGASSLSTVLDEGYIEFAGFTAGLAQSFFDFFGNGPIFAEIAGSDNETAYLLGYRASLGNGWSAAVSLEDRDVRRKTGAGVALPLGSRPVGGPFGTFAYGGTRMPDIVAALRVEQAWGQAQLSAAVRELRSAAIAPVAGATDFETEYGFAVQFGTKINLPMLARGDELWLQAAYAYGAADYAIGTIYGNGATFGPALTAAVPLVDGFYNPAGEIERSKAFSAMAMLQHFWTPTIRHLVFGSYSRLDYDNGFTLDTRTGARGGYVSWNAFHVGTQLAWIPVRNFRIGIETVYVRLDPQGRVADTTRNGAGAGPFTKGSFDTIDTKIRFERDF